MASYKSKAEVASITPGYHVTTVTDESTSVITHGFSDVFIG